jgi:sporulation protein YlmC with PRC-barrel domain
MQLKHCLAPALAIALMAPVSAVAQETDQQQGQQQTQPADRQDRDTEQRRDTQGEQRRDAEAQTTQRQGAQAQQIVRADRLMGQTVRDRGDERVGRVNDLAVNIQEGRIAYAVVTRGGVWGIGGEDVAVSWQQVQPDAEARVVRIDAQQLQQAKQIESGQTWPATIGGGEGPVGTAGTAPHHNVLPMSALIGMDVHNKQGERLGQIDDVAIGRDGSLGYVVIAHGGFMGVGDNYVAVPWDRLTLDAQRQGAVLNVTRQQLEGVERFDAQRGTWPERVTWPFTENR